MIPLMANIYALCQACAENGICIMVSHNPIEAAVIPILQMQTSVGLLDLSPYDQVPSPHAVCATQGKS